MTCYKHKVSSDEEQIRLDKLLTTLHEGMSRSKIQSWIKKNVVLVNNHYVKANYLCQQGDVIQWTIPKEETLTIQPENIPLSIVYEDDDLLVVNKPKGMVVHPTSSHRQGTLVNALLHHTTSLSRLSGAERPGIVHRLDKDTSGLLVIAKTDEVHEHLVRQMIEQTIERTYEAIVHGMIEHNHGKIDAPIGRDPNNRLQMTVIRSGKKAVTHFSVIERMHDYSHIECKLETGRTHQIRVHLKYIGHPIVGDKTYMNGSTRDISGQSLFAKSLGFIHPTMEKRMNFTIDQPTYFSNLLNDLRNQS